ncbi:MAG: inorganic triphosphatase [Aeromonas sp.]
MQTEIEIKFFVVGKIHTTLTTLLNSLEINASSSQQLGNVYFDTPTLALRQLEMGLRIRRCDDFAEQTIKCRGHVVGGLHARPEYNAPVSGDLPQLSVFPAQIWPDLATRDHIQQQLAPQFCTDFLRRSWQITFADAQIELAWDQGEIVGSQGRTEINELELELKSGDTCALFALAARVAQIGGLRLGLQSKAQQGYQLAGLGKPLTLQTLAAPVHGPALANISDGLQHWQHHEQLWLTLSPHDPLRQQALHALCQGIELIIYSTRPLPPSIPWALPLSRLHAHLTGAAPQPGEWPLDLATLFLYPDYVQLQLAVTAWLHHAT